MIGSPWNVRSLLAGLTVLLLLGVLGSGVGANHVGKPQGATISALSLPVPGLQDVTAKGIMGIPAKPMNRTVLLVYAHPYGDIVDVNTTWTQAYKNVKGYANQGIYTVAMEYRGGIMDWKVSAGAVDTMLAIEFMKSSRRFDRIILWGQSMGGQVAGTVVMDNPEAVDYVVFDVGVADLPLFYENAPVANATGGRAVQEKIRNEMGRKAPLDDLDLYAARSPALNTTGFEDAGLERAYLVYAQGDRTVQPLHGQRLADNLVRQNVATSSYVVNYTPAQGIDAHSSFAADLVWTLTQFNNTATAARVDGTADVVPNLSPRHVKYHPPV